MDSQYSRTIATASFFLLEMDREEERMREEGRTSEIVGFLF